jgi:hypothetical protein
MRNLLTRFALAAMFFTAGSAAAVDFASIDRHIVKEPAYKHKPLYCLALIGPEAKTRVWLVLDGEKLYVDKNCNGDLTDDGPPGELSDKQDSFDIVDVSPDGGKTVYQFDVFLWNRPALRDPTREPFNQSVHVTFPDKRRFGAWGDHHRPLMFDADRDRAPVLHYDGPLRMGFEIRKPLALANGGYELSACVGTPGSAPGAWVHLMYRTIPAEVHPRAVLEFPPETPGGKPVRVEFTLGQRC